MAWAIEQVPAPGRVEVEENAGNHNDLLFETGLEEVEAVRDRARETLQIEPQVLL